MADTAIRVENLGKQYRVGLRQEPYQTLRDTVTDAVTAPFRGLSRLVRGEAAGAGESDGKFWALRDVSFEVKPGEIVGIIGRNGAGKSTLLKILTRITEPTTGKAWIRGRVGSLLEVGTGFHPELTGRENIYLNGAILGMRKHDIDAQFDEIVAFAEIEKFLDTPVKHYSSGMYLRLAFSVAAHLEPDVLIVDEVLAVGDMVFQKKCLNKMDEVGKHGRTVLLVSHNMQAVTRMCTRAILLDEGRIKFDGPSREVVSTYLNSGVESTAERIWTDPATAPGGEIAQLRAVRVRTEDGEISDSVDIRQQVIIEMEYQVLKPGFVHAPNFSIWTEEGICAFASLDLDPAWRGRPRPAGLYRSRATIPGNFLSESFLFVRVDLATLNPILVQCIEQNALAFRVVDSGDGDTARGGYNGKYFGVVRPRLTWKTERLAEVVKSQADTV